MSDSTTQPSTSTTSTSIPIVHLHLGDEAMAVKIAERFKLGGLKPEGFGPEHSASLLADKKNILLAAIENNEPVGFLIGYEMCRIDRPNPMMLLYEIAVAAGHRQRGIGRRLVDRFIDIAIERRALKAWVVTGQTNHAAQRLYEAAGAGKFLQDDILVYIWPPDAETPQSKPAKKTEAGEEKEASS